MRYNVGNLDVAVISDGYIKLDASLAENHRRESEITQYPVEVGGNISDHVRPKPIMLTIKGIISATPIQVDFGVPSPTRVQDARARMIKWRDAGTLLDVYTNKEIYRQLAIALLTEDSDWQNGNDFEFDVTFQQVTTSAVAYVQAPTPKGNIPKPTSNDGTQPNVVTEKSAAAALLDAGK